MWTFDDFPAGRVERSLGVRLDRAWLDHVQGASVRLTTGCSASVVSPEGLALTNHHCVMACEQSLSSQAADYIADGFLTEARADERPCPGMQAEILVGITDVTGRIFAAAAGKVGDDYVTAREGAISGAERNACGADERLRCQVISFFGGGLFKVYKYRKFPDVRLVFAPEFAAAFFGGDSGQFQLPPLRPRLRLPAPLRRRQAGRDPRLSGLVRPAAQGRRGGVRVGQPRRHRAGLHRRPAGKPARYHHPDQRTAAIGASRPADPIFRAGPGPRSDHHRSDLRSGE